jgi:hypothetical protein
LQLQSSSQYPPAGQSLSEEQPSEIAKHTLASIGIVLQVQVSVLQMSNGLSQSASTAHSSVAESQSPSPPPVGPGAGSSQLASRRPKASIRQKGRKREIRWRFIVRSMQGMSNNYRLGQRQ